MKKYTLKNINSREELENLIINDLGKSTEKKNAVIVGTTSDLLKVKLSHGQSVWGVTVEASDFVATPMLDKPQRGPNFKSSLNYSKNETN